MKLILIIILLLDILLPMWRIHNLKATGPPPKIRIITKAAAQVLLERSYRNDTRRKKDPLPLRQHTHAAKK